MDFQNRLFELSTDMLGVADMEGRFKVVNPAFERVLGYSSQELKERSIFDFVHPDDVAESLAQLQSLNVGSEMLYFEHRFRCKDKSFKWLEWSGAPDVSQGFIYAVGRDITEIKEQEKQLRQAQKMETVGQLTGGIAHDFNNLLTIIIGNLQLLEEAAEQNEEFSALIRDALHAGFRGSDLTKRLLAYSRLQLLAPQVMVINELVAGIKPLLERTLGESVSLKLMAADDIWTTRVDPGQLENALVNLAINARDAMPNGGRLTIEISNSALDESYAASHHEVTAGEYVLLTVSDTGCGIKKEALAHVFEPFFTTKDAGKGSGLGLSMVYGFVKQSQGHIKIYSEEGYGTTVSIYLRRSRSAAEVTGATSTRRAQIPSGHETILLVEDDAAVRRIAVALLIALGYRVLEAGTGAQALAILDEREDIDLLFTDIVMPGGMTGTELARHANERIPNLQVLFTSGYTDAAVFDNGLLKPGGAILNKPYRKNELAQKVREVLDRE